MKTSKVQNEEKLVTIESNKSKGNTQKQSNAGKSAYGSGNKSD